MQAAGLDTQLLPKMEPYFTKASESNVQSAFNKFVNTFSSAAGAINSIKIDGIGPGELLMYFIFDNISVGGKNAPIDLYLDGKEWAEAKAGAPVGDSTLTNFKITKDSAKAVTQIMKDLEAFNEAYSQITGEDLPDWRGASELKADTLRGWVDIDLKKLAKENKGQAKKPIDLKLQRDGELKQAGSSDPILNVKKDKSTAPLRDLITGEVEVDDKISTLDKIIKAWAKQAFDEYVKGKRFVLFSSKTGKLPQIRYVGMLTVDMIGLYNTHRQQPWAEIYLDGEKPVTKKPAAKKEATK